VWGVGCGVWGVGCGVWGVGCGVLGVGFKVQGVRAIGLTAIVSSAGEFSNVVTAAPLVLPIAYMYGYHDTRNFKN
jgi:hypothetical protein